MDKIHDDSTGLKSTIRSRWFSRLQFSLAGLLKFVAVVAVVCAWWADRERLNERFDRLENDQLLLAVVTNDDGVEAKTPAKTIASFLRQPRIGSGFLDSPVPSAQTWAWEEARGTLARFCWHQQEFLSKELPDDETWPGLAAVYNPTVEERENSLRRAEPPKAAAPQLRELAIRPGGRVNPLRIVMTLSRVDPQWDAVDGLVGILDQFYQNDQETIELHLQTIEAIAALAQEKAGSAAPAVAKFITHANLDLRKSAVNTYAKLAEPDEAISTLQSALKSEGHERMRAHIARTILALKHGRPQR